MPNLVTRIFVRLSVVLFVFCSLPAVADEGGLDAIIKRGTVLVGIDLTSPPFGMQDQNMQAVGSDVDVANLLAKALSVKLEIVPVTSANRIPFLLTKRVDFIISQFAITPERAKSITFSIPYGGMRAVVVANKKLQIASAKDLVGKKVSVARGTTNEPDLNAIAPPGAQIMRFDDEASAQAALVSGQVDAYATGEIITKAFSDRNLQLELEPKFTLRNIFFGIGIRRGDADLARWVDIWIMSQKQEGSLNKIFEHWLGHAMADLPVF
jgi:polar amino acid transport system substrate-binding protein